MISATQLGASSGIDRLWHIGSQELGTVEDLAPGSSPIHATAPPFVAVPATVECRMASAARSRPGFLPYQKPVTPSWRRPGTLPSDLRPGHRGGLRALVQPRPEDHTRGVQEPLGPAPSSRDLLRPAEHP